MNRDMLISQVKDEYARLADAATKENFVDEDESRRGRSNEAYYEELLQNVIYSIQDGRFDGFASGKEIVETVANNKEKWL